MSHQNDTFNEEPTAKQNAYSVKNKGRLVKIYSIILMVLLNIVVYFAIYQVTVDDAYTLIRPDTQISQLATGEKVKVELQMKFAPFGLIPVGDKPNIFLANFVNDDQNNIEFYLDFTKTGLSDRSFLCGMVKAYGTVTKASQTYIQILLDKYGSSPCPIVNISK